MGVKYTQEFRESAVALLNAVNNNEEVRIDGELIYSVKQLCLKLKISSYSLYEWKKQLISREEILAKHGKLNGNIKSDVVITNFTTYEKKDNTGVPDKDKLYVNSEIRFFGNLASMLGISGYNKMNLNQLQYYIGKKLIERSGIGVSLNE